MTHFDLLIKQIFIINMMFNYTMAVQVFIFSIILYWLHDLFIRVVVDTNYSYLTETNVTAFYKRRYERARK